MDPRRILNVIILLFVLVFAAPLLSSSFAGMEGFAPIVAALLFFTLWAVFDAALRAESQWHAIDQSKLVWVLILLFVPVLGALVYSAAVRPRLARVETVSTLSGSDAL